MTCPGHNVISRGGKTFPLCWTDSEGHCACGRGHSDKEAGKAPLTPNGVHDGTGDVSERLFMDDGEQGTTLTKAMEFLTTFQNEIVATEKLLAPLAETEVLTLQRLDLTNAEGKTISIDGVRAIDREKLMALDDATLAGWVRSGLMVVIDAHLASLKNFAVLTGRQGTETQAPGEAAT